MADKPAPKKRRQDGVTNRVTGAQLRMIRELSGQKVSLAEISRRTGLARSTVTMHARRMGLEANQAPTPQAVAARLEMLKARRVEIASMLESKIEALHDRLWSEHQYYERGQSEMIPVTLPLPPLRDVRDGYGALTMAVKSYSDLINASSAATAGSDRAMLTDLFGKLKVAVEEDKAALRKKPPDKAGTPEPDKPETDE